MNRTIEINEEVYEALLGDVTSFEESPNTILKRWANSLDKMKKKTPTPPPLNLIKPDCGIFLGKKPSGFCFLEEYYRTSNWVDVFLKICEILARRNSENFLQVLNLRGPLCAFFSMNPGDLMAGQCEKIPGTNIYAGTKYSAQALMERCYKLIHMFGYEKKEFSIHIEKERKISVSSNLRPSRTQKVEGNEKYIPNHKYTGEQLIRKYNLGVKQARYHKDGHFYEKLSTFPAAFCDPDGYVRFESREEYLRSPYLNLGQKVNVPGGIARLPKYTLFPKEI